MSKDLKFKAFDIDMKLDHIKILNKLQPISMTLFNNVIEICSVGFMR